MVTKEQCMAARYGDHFRYLQSTYKSKDRAGEPIQVRVSGQCQTWKRMPERFRLPVKYGMYENGEINNENAALYISEAEYQQRAEQAGAVASVLSYRKNPTKLTPVAANQTELETDDGVTVFFSYKTPVAAHVPGEGFYVTDKNWSRTTSKHIGMFLRRHGEAGKARGSKPQEWFDALVQSGSTFKRNPREDGSAKWGTRYDADVRRIAHKLGWEVIRIGPINIGGGGIAPNCILLSKVGGYQPYATHYINLQDGGAYWGHYFESLTAAQTDFVDRVRVNTPGDALGTMRRNPSGNARIVHNGYVIDFRKFFNKNPATLSGKNMIALQERCGTAWITLAMFRLDKKEFAKAVAKRYHRRYPGKQLRLFS